MRIAVILEERRFIGYKINGGGSAIKDLATEFGVHRTTVTTVLQREQVEVRKAGLNASQLEQARTLYRDGSSLARLGEKFGVDGTTVWRCLLLAGVVMRSPNERRVRP